MLLNAFIYCFGFVPVVAVVVAVYHRTCAFVIFISFFDEVPNFCNKISTSQKQELVDLLCVSCNSEKLYLQLELSNLSS